MATTKYLNDNNYFHPRYEHDRGEYRTVPDTAQIFSTFPSPHLSYAGGIFDQFLGSALLLICVCAITDSRNMKVREFSVSFLSTICYSLDYVGS